MLHEQIRWRDWRAPVAGFVIVQAVSSLAACLIFSAGLPYERMGFAFELPVRVSALATISRAATWLAVLALGLAFASHSVED